MPRKIIDGKTRPTITTDPNITDGHVVETVICGVDGSGSPVRLTVDGSGNLNTAGGGGGGGTVTTKASPLAWVDGSGTIATGGAAQTIFNANATRARLVIQNQSTGLLFINFGVPAVTDQPSIRLEPYDIWMDSGPSCTNQSVSIIGDATGQAFTAKEA